MRRALDAAEVRLAAFARVLGTPRGYLVASVALVALAFLVRLPLVARATDVWAGHPDSWVYFHQAFAEYLRGNVYVDGHRGSGWQLLLFATLSLFGSSPPDGWTPYGTQPTGEALEAALVAHALSACASVGVVAATLLLAREVLPAPAAILAGALVALDPYLMRLATTSLSEPLYIPLFILATTCVLRARRHPAWLLGTAALMALAHILKVNGLVMFGALGIFTLLLLRERPTEFFRGMLTRPRERRLALWGVAAVATFLLVASPYLAWRASELSGPFDYGTNQRFWADDLWDLDDAWWTAYQPGTGAPRETMADYFANHTWRDAALRLWQSAEWQLFDLFGSGRWPAQEHEGGVWVGTAPEESALTPLLAGLSLVAAFTALRRREWWFLPVTLAATFLTFLWIYPLVRSVRYFSPLIPLFVLAAVAGWLHLATLVRRPHVAALLVFGLYLGVYAGVPLLHVAEGLPLLANARVATLVLVFLALWIVVALSPLLPRAFRHERREPEATPRDT